MTTSAEIISASSILLLSTFLPSYGKSDDDSFAREVIKDSFHLLIFIIRVNHLTSVEIISVSSILYRRKIKKKERKGTI